MTVERSRKRVVIMGAAGRDFHNFNMVYRDDPGSEVVAFTAAQIPHISGRLYPAALAGALYPDGIPIHDECELADICRARSVDEVVFAYSDVEHVEVMHRASIALASGADFVLQGPRGTMLASKIPVIAVCAVRTGVGKSQTTRWLSRLARSRGFRVAVVRHPMPYGDLARQAVQRFAKSEDFDDANCTIEEREEYEPHVEIGNVVFAGVDYARVLAAAEMEADLILWDGGNNDFSFIKPDLRIVLVDPLRAGHELTHHPGEAVLRAADIVIVAKTNGAEPDMVRQVTRTSHALAPRATIFPAASIVTLSDPDAIRGKRVLVVEDGPTITHGGMPYGAGYVAVAGAGVAEIVDPRESAVGEIADIYRKYPHIGRVLPAMGYTGAELDDLRATIAASRAEVVVCGTPIDLFRVLGAGKPVVRARYEFAEVGEPRLSGLISGFLDGLRPRVDAHGGRVTETRA